ncbi:unnamed protein product, partial [Amoebophrya sp. A120]
TSDQHHNEDLQERRVQLEDRELYTEQVAQSLLELFAKHASAPPDLEHDKHFPTDSRALASLRRQAILMKERRTTVPYYEKTGRDATRTDEAYTYAGFSPLRAFNLAADGSRGEAAHE